MLGGDPQSTYLHVGALLDQSPPRLQDITWNNLSLWELKNEDMSETNFPQNIRNLIYIYQFDQWAIIEYKV